MLEGIVDSTVGADNVPKQPGAFHIVHVKNLAAIFDCGHLYSDGHLRRAETGNTVIGFEHLKSKRLNTFIPGCDGLTVGDCVPFYLCPRSVMLYVIYRADSPQLVNHDGQKPVVHLRFDLRKVVDWAQNAGLRTFITNANAASDHTEVFETLSGLRMLDWDSINTARWSDPVVKSHKSSEFLVEDRVHISLLEEIGVIDESMRKSVVELLQAYPQFAEVPVRIAPNWYY